MRKKLKFQCPCGYGFEMFGIANDAVSMIKLHDESFHKNYLPFGITNDEAQNLLNHEHEKKPKISKRAAYLVQTESAYNFKNKISTGQSLLDELLGEKIEVDYRRTEQVGFLSYESMLNHESTEVITQFTDPTENFMPM